MREEKQPIEYQPNGAPTYQTGSTKPPKSHVGIVAFLLSAVIFICSISTILSLMRINLLQNRRPQAESKVSFATQPSSRLSTEPCSLGLFGHGIPEFWQDYRALPEGVFITYAHAGREVFVGDILQTVNGQPVTDWEELLSILEQYSPGQQVTVTVYRKGANQKIRMIIER